MAVGEFKGGLSEVRVEMSDIKSQLTTILTALSRSSRKQTWVIKDLDDASNSDNKNPVRPPPRKAKKQKRKRTAPTATFSKGDKYAVGMWFNQGWDDSTKTAFNAAKKVYGKKHPTFAKQEKARQRLRLQRELDKLDEE